MGSSWPLLLGLVDREVVVVLVIVSPQAHLRPRAIESLQDLDRAPHQRGICAFSPKQLLHVAAFQIEALGEPVDVILESEGRVALFAPPAQQISDCLGHCLVPRHGPTTDDGRQVAGDTEDLGGLAWTLRHCV